MYSKSMFFLSLVVILSLVGSAASQGTGLRGEYFRWSGSSPPSRENAFRNLIATRIDPQIYCYWNPGFVATHPDGLTPDLEIHPPEGLPSDNFAVRWTGEVEAQYTEAYKFTIGSDDGARLWINGELIVESWSDHDRSESASDPIELVAAQKYPIVYEGYEAGGEAEWQLYWESPSTPRQLVPQEVLYPVIKAQDFPASDPIPADGEVLGQTWVTAEWTAGPRAVSHDVYFGDNLASVEAGTAEVFLGNQTQTNFIVGFPGFPYPDGLVAGTTYYWRIDEVNDMDQNSPWTGSIWGFTVTPKTAWDPDPADGAEGVELDDVLSWQSGFGGKLHYVYFGDDFDTVSDATGALPAGMNTYSPGTLEEGKVYYWRVDEFEGPDTHKGEVWSFSTAGAVGSPTPPYGAVDVKHTQILKWVAGQNAGSHQVYFGTNREAVRSADTSSPEYKGAKDLGAEKYDPGLLEWDTDYYWRIDEVNNLNTSSPWKGNVWPFTTANFFVVDDFEDYNDFPPDEIWNSWIDGFGDDTNGSTAGYPDPIDFAAGEHYVETEIVHSGAQSMPYLYDVDLKYAEATKTLTYPRNWTERGVDTLAIWFKGDWINVAARMYVAVANSTGAPAVVHHDDPEVTRIDVWTQWKIPLQLFADQGIDL
ncbi:MAG: PA14 domain-containing protein, partial [Planctomycetota bacterium]